MLANNLNHYLVSDFEDIQMNTSRVKYISIAALIAISASFSLSLMAKEVKTLKITDRVETSRVGGNMRATHRESRKSFRVSSGNVIYPDTIKVRTISPGHGGSCSLNVVKSVEYEVSPAPGLPPVKRKYPVEIELVTKAVSPGCTLFNPVCVGRSSIRSCELTAKYTD